MSRIIVKNLPKNITDTKLREIFGAKGHVTDVQLKYTKDGKFRQFAFVGFKEEAEANGAIEYFDKTSINTNKITVQKCAQLGDASKPKSWSKYAVDSSAYKSKHKIEEIVEDKVKPAKNKLQPAQELLEKYKDDPEFEEFLNVQSDKTTKELLDSIKTAKKDENAEDDVETEGKDEEDNNNEEEVVDEKEKVANKNISDLEYMKMLQQKAAPEVKTKKEKPRKNLKLFTLKMRNLPSSCKKKDIKAFFKPLYIHSLRLPRNIRNIAFVGFLDEKNFKVALNKDKSFIKGKQIEVKEYVDFNKNESNAETSDVNNKWKYQEDKLKNEEEIAESGRIFIRNLSYTSTEDEVQKLFEKYGPIADFNLPIDATTRKPKGFATVTFLMPENAVHAYTELDGTIFHGRMLHLLRGKSKENAEDDGEETTDYKKKKAKELKKKAGLSHNWNSLFLGHDAVAEVIASTYGTTKEAVLDPRGAGNAAVRLALGETQIVAQTRKHLEEHGVILDAFNGVAAKRSKTIIIAKNLPANTTGKDIQSLFQPHGHLGRVILPPSGITAIVEFVEPSEAKKAFTRLAYTKFKNLPLYLEWAPENSLTGGDNKQAAVKDVEAETKSEAAPAVIEEEEEDEDEEPEPDTTLFVKNLNFETTDDVLKKHFASCGKIAYANVATKKDLKDASKKLSMGYGFVRFYHKESANKALKNLQQSVLDGKSLELKRSERTLPNDAVVARKTTKKIKQTGSKICVRNVPFQANHQDLLELFKTFGEIKSLRLPKKMGPTNQHRGFGFVDFATNADAKKAFEALSQSTHVLGRRLVLEWAATEDSIDDIRKRTADHFHEASEPKKSKKSVFDIEAM